MNARAIKNNIYASRHNVFWGRRAYPCIVIPMGAFPEPCPVFDVEKLLGKMREDSGFVGIFYVTNDKGQSECYTFEEHPADQIDIYVERYGENNVFKLGHNLYTCEITVIVDPTLNDKGHYTKVEHFVLSKDDEALQIWAKQRNWKDRYIYGMDDDNNGMAWVFNRIFRNNGSENMLLHHIIMCTSEAKSTDMEVTADSVKLTFGIKYFYNDLLRKFSSHLSRLTKECNKRGFRPTLKFH